MEWKDQGWGGQKGRVALFADGVRVYTTPRAQHVLTVFESGAIELAAGVKDLEFKFVVGSGGGHSITINDFAWSWSPLVSASPLSPPPAPPPASPPPPPPVVLTTTLTLTPTLTLTLTQP